MRREGPRFGEPRYLKPGEGSSLPVKRLKLKLRGEGDEASEPFSAAFHVKDPGNRSDAFPFHTK